MKAYAAAEWAMELALYKVKDKGYGYDNIEEDINIFGIENKEAKISYDFDSKVSEYNGELAAYGTDIIPLFWINDTSDEYITSPKFTNVAWDLVWNIIGTSGGISWKWSFFPTTLIWEKKSDGYSDIQIWNFINQAWREYLIIYNPSSHLTSYSLEVPVGEHFTRPRADIYSSARVGKYVQNIKTRVDNTEFLGILKYSIYSWN